VADKRELLLIIKGKDQGAKDALEGVAEGAEDAQDELGDLNRGLKKLDGQIAASTNQVEALRREISKSGDLGLVKDLEKAQRELNKLTKQRKLIVPVELDVDRKGLDESAEEAATGFTTRLVARLGPLVVSKAPALAGAGGPIAAGLAAGALPVLGAAIAGAVIGGAGIGGVVGGLAIASKHPAVKAEAESLKEDVGRALERAAEPMVPATIDSLKIIRRKFHEAEDDISGIFEAAAEHAPVLAEGAGEGIKSVISGIRELVQRADPVIDALADGFRDLGAAVEDGLGDLADNANEGARALQLTLAVVEGLAKATFKVVDGLAEAYGWMDSVAGLLRGDPGPLIRNLYEDAYEAERSARDLTETQRGLIGGYHLTAEAAEEAARATRDYADANRTLTDQNLSVAESTLRYKEATEAARDAIDKKKEVGLEEQKALLSQARASNTLIESLDRQGASAAVLGAQHDEARKQLIRTAERMGYTKQQAASLADQYLATPRQINTLFTADTDQAARNLRDVRDLIARIKSKRVVITVDTRGRQTTRSEGRNVGIGDGIGGREKGGPVRAGEAYLVGEKRPEVFVPDRDGTIIPSIEKFKRGGALGGGGTMQVRVSAAPGLEGEASRLLMKLIRVEVAGPGSGSVQRAFG
jgi:hypothetical protein